MAYTDTDTYRNYSSMQSSEVNSCCHPNGYQAHLDYYNYGYPSSYYSNQGHFNNIDSSGEASLSSSPQSYTDSISSESVYSETTTIMKIERSTASPLSFASSYLDGPTNRADCFSDIAVDDSATCLDLVTATLPLTDSCVSLPGGAGVSPKNSPLDKTKVQHPSLTDTHTQPQESSSRRKVKANRRGTTRNNPLPASATDVMNSWFSSHLDHPYPTQAEKDQMIKVTGITLKQLNHWFNNRRSRSSHTAPKRQKRKLEQQLANLCHDIAGSQDAGCVAEKLNSMIQESLGPSAKRRR